VAAGALEQVWHDRLLARIRDVFANRRWSPEWEDAAGSSTTVTFLTPEELETVQDEINAILARHWDERRLDPAQRPAGALPVEIVAFAYPRQDLAAPLPADDNDDDNDDDDNDNDDDEPA
jgi:hypothetical protein